MAQRRRYNDAEMAEYAADVARRLGFSVVPEEQSLGGDDFSFYEEKAPGCYIKIGTGKGQLIHQPGFAVEESVLEPTAEYLTEVLMGGTIERKRE